MSVSATRIDEPIAVLDSVSVQDRRGNKILDRGTLRIGSGKINCLVGPSGSGKTTAAFLLLGLLPAGLRMTEGSCEFDGRSLDPNDPAGYSDIRGKDLAIVFQDPFATLNPLRRCGAQVADPLVIHEGLSTNEAKTRVLAQFESMGFDDPERIYRAFPAQLSGGQRQRVVLALATILRPRLLVADEPTASLDAASQAHVIELLHRLAKEGNTAVLLISHDVTLVRSVGDVFMEIHDGRINCVDRGTLSGDLRRAETGGPDAGPPLLNVEALSKSYRSEVASSRSPRDLQVLREVSLEASAGEIVGIFGPSGIGKSTLGRCIAGLEAYEAGKVVLDQRPVEPSGLRPHDGRVQMIYQSPASSLNPRMRVSATIKEALRQAGVSDREFEKRISILLAQVDLPPSMSDRYPRWLSGGEKQRVAIARCLARNPRLVVADEPTASLDEKNKHSVLALLRHLAGESRFAVLLITHERELAWSYCDRVLEFAGGRLVPAVDPEAA